MNLCACMGPQGNDPVCPCKMRAAGKQPTSYWTDESREQLKNAFVKIQETESKMQVDALDSAIHKLMLAMAASCTCLTKSPDVQYHRHTCRFRLISDAIALLQDVMPIKS